MTVIDSWQELFGRAKVTEFSGHKSKVQCLDWNLDGTLLATGGADHSIRLWTFSSLAAGSGSKSTELKGHTGAVDQLAWSPTESNLLASISTDKTIRLWDTRTHTCQQTIPAGENINLAWHPTGDLLAVSSRDDNLSIVDVRQATVICQRKFNQEVNELAWTLDNRLLITKGDGHFELLDYPGLETLTCKFAHTSNCFCIKLHPNKKLFAIGAADALASLWTFPTLHCKRTFGRMDWPIRTMSFGMDGQVIAMGSEDAYIEVAEVDSGDSVLRIPVSAPVSAMAWNPHKPMLAFASDTTDPKTGRPSGTVAIFTWKI